MACVPHLSAPAAPSRQALAPGSLPLGKGTQARSKQDSRGICSLSSLTKCPAGRGPGSGEEGMETESEEGMETEERKERQKGRKETEAEAQREGERG